MVGRLNTTANKTGVEFTLNGGSLMTPAYQVLDLLPLWLPGRFRGKSLTIPGAFGQRPKRVRIDETNVSLKMAFAGDFDWNGTPYDDLWTGLITNVEFFYQTFVVPPTLPELVRAASLTMEDATVRTGEVQVLGLIPGTVVGGTSSPVLPATLELRIPGGRLA